jgi:hypothetical protein
MRRWQVLSLLILAMSLPLAACASSSQSASRERNHPGWLVGSWRAIGWQVGAGDSQVQRDVTVTFAHDGTWKASGGGSGTSWEEVDQVIFAGVTPNGESFKSVLKPRQATDGTELSEVANARAGTMALSLKKLP